MTDGALSKAEAAARKKRLARERERRRLVRLHRYESDARDRGFRLVGGMDEVGRGPLAGPVVAACVVTDGPADVARPRRLEEGRAGATRSARRRDPFTRGRLGDRRGVRRRDRTPQHLLGVGPRDGTRARRPRDFTAFLAHRRQSASDRSAANNCPSSKATRNARPSPPHRSWRRSIATPSSSNSIARIRNTASPSTKGTRRPGTSPPSSDTVRVRTTGGSFLRRARRADAVRRRGAERNGRVVKRARVGAAGEDRATAYLTALGFRIERRNLRTPGRRNRHRRARRGIRSCSSR